MERLKCSLVIRISLAQHGQLSSVIAYFYLIRKCPMKWNKLQSLYFYIFFSLSFCCWGGGGFLWFSGSPPPPPPRHWFVRSRPYLWCILCFVFKFIEELQPQLIRGCLMYVALYYKLSQYYLLLLLQYLYKIITWLLLLHFFLYMKYIFIKK